MIIKKILKKIFYPRVIETVLKEYFYEIELINGEVIQLSTNYTIYDCFEDREEIELMLKEETRRCSSEKIKKITILGWNEMTVKHYDTLTDIPPRAMTKKQIIERNKKY